MKTQNKTNNVAINNVNNKEEITMSKPFVFVPATKEDNKDKEMITMNMNKVNGIVNMNELVNNVTKTSDNRYVKKDDLAKFLSDNKIIDKLSKNELKKTKRDELVSILNAYVDNLINTGVVKPLETVVLTTNENIENICNTTDTDIVPTGDFVYDKMVIDDDNELEYYAKLADYENDKNNYKRRKIAIQLEEEAWQRLANTTGLTFDNGTKPETLEMTEEEKFNTVVKKIAKASFVANKGDSKGFRIITMKALYGIIRNVYANGNEKLEEDFIKNIINKLVSNNYLNFKRYESGALMFYPTVKCREYIK